MATSFDLVINADEANSIAELRLCDPNGVQLAYRPVDFNALPVSRRRAIFDLHGYLRHYVEPQDRAAEIAEIGVLIAEQVLGKEIFEKLWNPQSQRTLRIVLPGANGKEDELVAALARIPWEIARPKPEAQTLGERNLVLRVVHDTSASPSTPLELAPDEELRVLFIFAESRGSTPLGMREERRALKQLFEREIYPGRRVVAHFLSHGVTRERLREQVEEQGGYHVVHWSGHGRANRLELCCAGGEADPISGDELLQMFVDAGGFLPRLFVLSACHSGSIPVRDWDDFLAVAAGRDAATPTVDLVKDLDLGHPPGFIGTAHALLQEGVSSVVAMRYTVSDDYARELAVEFYRALLVHAQPKSVAVALSRARQRLRAPQFQKNCRFSPTDPATPVLFGAEDASLPLAEGKSSALKIRRRRLHSIGELVIAEHPTFVGRTWELASFGADFIGSRRSTGTKPVALIVGLGGMGKTTLVAEILDLWEQDFDWVLLYQGKPNALGFDATLRDIDLKLREDSTTYRQHLGQFPADSIFREATANFRGAERNERLSRNLARALQAEKILLVFDNFETSLVHRATRPDSPAACPDPGWDACLAVLAKELPRSGSRVLITSRLPLAAIAGSGYLVVLGPLPPGEAALFLRSHPRLQAMANHSDADEQRLARRLLAASRFHPLLLDRLARLAARPELRPQLTAALEALEKTRNFKMLPELFSTANDDLREQVYLENALETSLDLLIREAGPDARRLLWIIAVANQPETLGLVRGVWSGEPPEIEPLRHLENLLAILPSLPLDLQDQLRAMPPDIRAHVEVLTPASLLPDLTQPLRHLVAVGLVSEERNLLEDENPDLACHDLVRERIRAFMDQMPSENVGCELDTVRIAYAESLAASYHRLEHGDMPRALEAGSRALVYYVQAQAWDLLRSFASFFVTSARDPRLLVALLPYFRDAAEAAPEGGSPYTGVAS